MSGDSQARLTELELQIVQCLRESGRITANDISRFTGADYRLVRRTLTHLLDSGTVHVTALADPSLTGEPVVAFVWLRSRSIENELAVRLRESAEVMWAVTTLDRTRTLIQVSCTNSSQLLRLLDRMRAWPDVVDVDSALVMRSYVGPQSVSTYQAPATRPAGGGTVWLGGESRSALDAIDRQILELLRADGRVALTTIAASADIPVTTARRRLERLLSVDGVQLRCRVSPAALGFRFLAMVGVRVNSDAAGLARSLASLPAACWVSEITGRAGVSVELMTADQAEMDAAIARIFADQRVRDADIEYYEGNLKDLGRW